MSLIEQALRRAQDPGIPQAKDPPQPNQAEPAPKPPIHPWQGPPPGRWSRALPLVAAATFAATGALIVIGALWIRATLARQAAQSPQPVAISAEGRASVAGPVFSAPAHPKPSPAPKRAQREEFILSGLIEGQGEPLAVINGEIVAVGDRIGSATFVGIVDGVARLRHDDGQEHSLQILR